MRMMIFSLWRAGLARPAWWLAAAWQPRGDGGQDAREMILVI
jgi:hypothetical protein